MHGQLPIHDTQIPAPCSTLSTPNDTARGHSHRKETYQYRWPHSDTTGDSATSKQMLHSNGVEPMPPSGAAPLPLPLLLAPPALPAEPAASLLAAATGGWSGPDAAGPAGCAGVESISLKFSLRRQLHRGRPEQSFGILRVSSAMAAWAFGLAMRRRWWVEELNLGLVPNSISQRLLTRCFR